MVIFALLALESSNLPKGRYESSKLFKWLNSLYSPSLCSTSSIFSWLSAKKNFLVAEFRDVEELLVDKVDDGVTADNGGDKTVIRA